MLIVGLLAVALVVPLLAGLLLVGGGCWWTYQAIMARRERRVG